LWQIFKKSADSVDDLMISPVAGLAT